MRPTITATILAIAASLAAGDNDRHLSSKSSKSACNSCSDSALGRTQQLTDLAFGMYAADTKVMTASTAVAFCADEDKSERFLSAADDIVGCLVNPTCLTASLLVALTDDEGDNQLTEGDFLASAIDVVCEADRAGVTQPEGGCGDAIESFCSQLL